MDTSAHVYTVGSSAGGYAALLFGNLLNVEAIYAFSPQIDIGTWSDKASLRGGYALRSIKWTCKNCYIFFPTKNKADIAQYNLLKKNMNEGVKVIRFTSKIHGVPFPNAALSSVLRRKNMRYLDSLSGEILHPYEFCISFIGLKKTIVGTVSYLIYGIKKKVKEYLK